MKQKLLKKYILLCIPFITGAILYSLSIYNIFSSILFFAGGYIAIKNMCDYRKIKKNINISKKIELKTINNSNNNINYRNIESIKGIKRNRVYKKVRRRY